MPDSVPQPLLNLQAVLGAAEITLRRVAVEVTLAQQKLAPLLPAESQEDDASEVPGVEGWALSLDAAAQMLIVDRLRPALLALDCVRRSSPAEPSPRPRPWAAVEADLATPANGEPTPSAACRCPDE